MATTRKKARSYPIIAAPKHEKLPWPGLKAKDHLSRVVTRAVKEGKEKAESEAWAEDQIARVLDHVSPEFVMRFVLRDTSRRGKPIPPFAGALHELLPG
jgi:hypothetical protein